jgi:hypothetical protein
VILNDATFTVERGFLCISPQFLNDIMVPLNMSTIGVISLNVRIQDLNPLICQNDMELTVNVKQSLGYL